MIRNMFLAHVALRHMLASGTLPKQGKVTIDLKIL